MTKRFYSARLPIFGTVAMLLLCLVFFMLPFAFRGAKLAIGEMKNNVADWLPDHFPETKDLKEFRKYFVGDQFVVISGPWCKEGNGAYTLLQRKIFEDSLEYERILESSQDSMKQEELRAHRKGDELGLMFTGNYHEDWGEQRERWLLGRNGQWYFINRQGQLFRWEGQNNVVEGVKRSLEKMVHGKNKANGVFIDSFGEPPNDEEGIENQFYADPQKLCARPFKNVTTGPDVFQKMAGENGTFRIGKYADDDAATFEAEVEAHKRLTGALFGPTPSKGFQWTFESLIRNVEDSDRRAALQSTPIHRERFDAFIERQAEERFGGDKRLINEASQDVKLEMWYGMWKALDMPAPPRQTCLIVTLNEPVLEQLDRVVGRPILGKVRGRILELATGECGIAAENLHIGGPPADNVAIDEEGTSTLLRLVSLSAFIGITLAYISFRSIPVTLMLFFVGGVSAISSLSYVWFGGSTLDAILMSMPSLVFVLGLAGAVHLVNYYRDACEHEGPDYAVEIAMKHGWFPCTLAAFTTALGLVSLYASSITPIKKFGLFSAIAVMATLILLFTYLPAALVIWSPGYKKMTRSERMRQGGLAATVSRMWSGIGNWVIGNWQLVCVIGVISLVGFGYGITRIKTSVHLLKLFDPSAKILLDYRWMEENFGKLVPAEVVVGFDLETQRAHFQEQRLASASPSSEAEPAKVAPEDVEKPLPPPKGEERIDWALTYSMLERMELSHRIRTELERFFGPNGVDIVGTGMSTDVFVPLHVISGQVDSIERDVFNTKLLSKRDEILEEQYLAVEGVSPVDGKPQAELNTRPENVGRELWRISIRLAALNSVDYGQFVNDLKSVVEPILIAYRKRTEILEALLRNEWEREQAAGEPVGTRILVLGRNPNARADELADEIGARAENAESIQGLVDQTYLFSSTLRDLLENRGFTRGRNSARRYVWIDPVALANREPGKNPLEDPEQWGRMLSESVDGVILIEDNELFDVDFIKSKCGLVFDCRDHQFEMDPKTHRPTETALTAKDLRDQGENVDISAMYTGIIPIVYKAQNQLLKSLINSIGLAFIMIAGVMMILLRDWSTPITLGNLINLPAGVVSMLPNVFPVVFVFGAMGWTGNLVDIGSMMTASVAMGVAVDDTIHFLSWYRAGLKEGLTRVGSIRAAYDRVATAMTQTTLIGGLGLFAFALSTFTPTQRFGVLMLFLLAAALIGDLIFLPALLASPLGKFFGKELPGAKDELDEDGDQLEPGLRVVGDEETDAHPAPGRVGDSPPPGQRQRRAT